MTLRESLLKNIGQDDKGIRKQKVLDLIESKFNKNWWGFTVNDDLSVDYNVEKLLQHKGKVSEWIQNLYIRVDKDTPSPDKLKFNEVTCTKCSIAAVGVTMEQSLKYLPKKVNGDLLIYNDIFVKEKFTNWGILKNVEVSGKIIIQDVWMKDPELMEGINRKVKILRTEIREIQNKFRQKYGLKNVILR